ncbi:hypothetical protein VTI74DRAFT_6163 [Chaetomium olivicolor]
MSNGARPHVMAAGALAPPSVNGSRMARVSGAERNGYRSYGRDGEGTGPLRNAERTALASGFRDLIIRLNGIWDPARSTTAEMPDSERRELMFGTLRLDPPGRPMMYVLYVQDSLEEAEKNLHVVKQSLDLYKAAEMGVTSALRIDAWLNVERQLGLLRENIPTAAYSTSRTNLLYEKLGFKEPGTGNWSEKLAMESPVPSRESLSREVQAILDHVGPPRAERLWQGILHRAGIKGGLMMEALEQFKLGHGIKFWELMADRGCLSANGAREKQNLKETSETPMVCKDKHKPTDPSGSHVTRPGKQAEALKALRLAQINRKILELERGRSMSIF